MKKVLFINLGKHYGGAEKLIELLAKENNSILALDIDGDFIRKINFDKIKVIECSTKKLKLIKSIFLLKKYIKQEDINIIHSHGVPSNLISLILKYLTGVKVMTTIHSDIEFDFTGIKKNIYIKLEKFILPRLDKIVCVSNELKSKVIKRCPEVKCTVIYNGINKPSSIQKKYTLTDNKDFVILSIGRLNQVKNQKLLIYALNDLKYYTDKFKCFIIGEGEERKNLQNLIKKYNLHNNIILEGFKDNIRDYMKNADVLVITSFMEGIPLVILEAFSERLLVLSSNVGGIKEVINDMNNGILFESNNIKELSSKLKKIIDGEIDNEILVHNAYYDFENKWIDEVMITEYKKNYNYL